MNFGPSAAAVNVSVVGSDGVRLGCEPCGAVTDGAVLCATSATRGSLTVAVGARRSLPVPFSVDVLLRPPVIGLVVNDTSGGAVLSDTRGGGLVRVVGTGFHSNYELRLLPAVAAAAVATGVISDAEREALPQCLLVPPTTSVLAHCVLPPGVGVGIQLVFYARGRLSVPAGSVSYAPPRLDSVVIVDDAADAAAAAGANATLNVTAAGAVASADAARRLPTAGGLIALRGANFGAAPGAVSVAVGGARCVIVGAVAHDGLRCVAPPGGAAAAPVTISVGGQSAAASAGAIVAYGPPVVERVDPPLAPTEGGTNATLWGANFDGAPGRGCPVVTVVLPPPLPPAPAAVLWCNSSAVRVRVPPGVSGVGDGARAGLLIAAAQTTLSYGAFGYLPPRIDSVALPGGCPVDGCTAWVNGDGFGGPGLPPTLAVVTVGGRPCAALSVSARAISCAVPPGAGTALDVRVSVLDRAGTAPGALSYDAPRVARVVPGLIDARAPASIVVVGAGFAAPGMALLIGGVPCGSPVQIFNSSAVGCATARVWRVGGAPVSVSVGGQRSNDGLLLLALCARGYYGLPTDAACAPCPEHALCLGGAMDPVPLAGFFRVSRAVMGACTPPEACLMPALPSEQAQRTEAASLASWNASVVAGGSGGGGRGGGYSAFVDLDSPNCAPAYVGALCGNVRAACRARAVVCANAELVPCARAVRGGVLPQGERMHRLPLECAHLPYPHRARRDPARVSAVLGLRAPRGAEGRHNWCAVRGGGGLGSRGVCASCVVAWCERVARRRGRFPANARPLRRIPLPVVRARVPGWQPLSRACACSAHSCRAQAACDSRHVQLRRDF